MADEEMSCVSEIQDIRTEPFTLDDAKHAHTSLMTHSRKRKLQMFSNSYTLFCPDGILPSDHASSLFKYQNRFFQILKKFQMQLPSPSTLFQVPVTLDTSKTEVDKSLQNDATTTRTLRSRSVMRLPIVDSDTEDELPDIAAIKTKNEVQSDTLAVPHPGKFDSDDEWNVEPVAKRATIRGRGPARKPKGTDLKTRASGKIYCDNRAVVKSRGRGKSSAQLGQKIEISHLDDDNEDLQVTKKTNQKTYKRKQSRLDSQQNKSFASQTVIQEHEENRIAVVELKHLEQHEEPKRKVSKQDEAFTTLNQRCRYCNLLLPSDCVTEHATVCVGPSFLNLSPLKRKPLALIRRARGAADDQSGTVDSGINTLFPNVVPNDSSQKEAMGECPICGISILQAELQRHVNRCLDNQ